MPSSYSLQFESSPPVPLSRPSLEEVLRKKKKPAPHRSKRAPPLSNRPLPCSPLVVHFKRHMVPSLCPQQQQQQQREQRELTFAPGHTHFKTKAEMKAEAVQHQQLQQQQRHMTHLATPHTPSSSPTPSPPPPLAPPTASTRVGVADMPPFREDPVTVSDYPYPLLLV